MLKLCLKFLKLILVFSFFLSFIFLDTVSPVSREYSLLIHYKIDIVLLNFLLVSFFFRFHNIHMIVLLYLISLLYLLVLSLCQFSFLVIFYCILTILSPLLCIIQQNVYFSLDSKHFVYYNTIVNILFTNFNC